MIAYIVGMSETDLDDTDGPSEDKMQRLLINLPSELLKRVDEYWHKRQFMSRAQTIRVLLEEGLGSFEDNA